MNTASFQQTIHNGMIRLPEAAKSMFDGTINVIVWRLAKPPKFGILRP